MKRLLLLLGIVATTANAECYMRSVSVAGASRSIERIADVRRTILPYGDQKTCLVQFRVQANGQWYSAEGEASGPADTNPGQLCGRALDLGRSQFLTKISATKKIQAEELMICSDQPEIKPREAVKVGDVVRESEVNPHPKKPYLFPYKGTYCKWFIETDAVGTDLMQYQGIICRVRNTDWQVIDKF